MSPTLPILGSAALVLAGGYAAEGQWPRYGTRSVVAYGLILLIVAFLAATRIRPIVSAFAWLVFLGAVYGTVPALAAGPRNDPRNRPRSGDS